MSEDSMVFYKVCSSCQRVLGVKFVTDSDSGLTVATWIKGGFIIKVGVMGDVLVARGHSKGCFFSDFIDGGPKFTPLESKHQIEKWRKEQ